MGEAFITRRGGGMGKLGRLPLLLGPELCDDITGGWSKTSGVLNTDNGVLTFTQTATSATTKYAYINNDVDMTKYATMRALIRKQNTAGTAGNYQVLLLNGNDYSNPIRTKNFITGANFGVVEFNLTSLPAGTDKSKLRVGLKHIGNNAYPIEVAAVWLEPIQ